MTELTGTPTVQVPHLSAATTTNNHQFILTIQMKTATTTQLSLGVTTFNSDPTTLMSSRESFNAKASPYNSPKMVL